MSTGEISRGTPDETVGGRPSVEAPRPGRSTAGAWSRYALGMGALAVIAWVVGQDAYWLNLLTLGLLFAGLASAWNIIGGLGGQFSLCHGVFFGLGAYSVALLQTRSGWSPWLAMLPAMAIAAVVAAGLALPMFRLRGHFFAIGTLALNEVAFALANYFDGLTGGPGGVSIGFQDTLFVEPWKYAVLMFAYVAIVVAITLAITRGRLGFYLIAVREDEAAARAAGVNPFVVKTVGFVLSAALTGLGGGLFAVFIRFIDPPTLFDLAEVGVRFPLLALIGGVGTVAGPVVGGLLVEPGAQYLRGELQGLGAGTHLIVLGAILVLASLFFKQGIVGALARLDLGGRIASLRGRRRQS